MHVSHARPPERTGWPLALRSLLTALLLPLVLSFTMVSCGGNTTVADSERVR